jgi:hypothetical protein
VLKDSGNLLGHNDLDHPYLRAHYSTGRTLAVDKQPSIPLTKRTTSRWRAPPILVQRASHLFPTRVRCLLTRLTLDTRVQQQLSKTILRSPSSSGACRRWFQVHKYLVTLSVHKLSHCHPFREVSKKDFIFILGSLYHFRIYTYEKLWSKTPRNRWTFHWTCYINGEKFSGVDNARPQFSCSYLRKYLHENCEFWLFGLNYNCLFNNITGSCFFSGRISAQ